MHIAFTVFASSHPKLNTNCLILKMFLECLFFCIVFGVSTVLRAASATMIVVTLYNKSKEE